MKTWVILTFIYAMFTGFFQCSKKKALEKNNIFEVLATMSLVSFIIAAFSTRDVFNIEFKYLGLIFLKSAVIVFSWLIALYAMKRISMSLYSVINLSRIIFAVFLSVVVLGEQLTITMCIGLMIVILGLVLVNLISNHKENKEASLKVVFVLMFSCFLNSISAIVDKKALEYITTSQLQFWFLLFLTILSWWVELLRNKKVDFKGINKNLWIFGAAFALTIGDKILFAANKMPESSVAIMTVIKQVSAIEMIILGKVLFKEKNIRKKLFCSLLIISGIILTLV